MTYIPDMAHCVWRAALPLSYYSGRGGFSQRLPGKTFVSLQTRHSRCLGSHLTEPSAEQQWRDVLGENDELRFLSSLLIPAEVTGLMQHHILAT